MARIIFVDSDGISRSVEAAVGESIMQAALLNTIPGIDAICGGACACGTCHVFVAEEWLDKVGKASETEVELLVMAADLRPNSRLSCQITMSDALDGIVVTTPPQQGW